MSDALDYAFVTDLFYIFENLDSLPSLVLGHGSINFFYLAYNLHNPIAPDNARRSTLLESWAPLLLNCATDCGYTCTFILL